MTQAQPLIQTLPMTLGAPMTDDPSNPTAIEIPLQIELPNGQTLFAAVALGGLPFDGQRQIAERMAVAWNAFAGVTTEEIKAPVKCLHQIAEPAAVHLDDVAVDALAALMKAKLAKQRAKGCGGWNDKIQCTQQRLSTFLRTHVDKGDPVDVANFCAMLSARGEGIAAAPQAVQPAVPFMHGIADGCGNAYFEEGCVAPEARDLQPEVDGLNSCLGDDERPYSVVPLYTQPASQGLEQDAERWGEVLRHVGAAPHFGGQHFTLNTLQAPDSALGFKANLMSGSVAQHFTKAIDAERAAQAKQGGAA